MADDIVIVLSSRGVVGWLTPIDFCRIFEFSGRGAMQLAFRFIVGGLLVSFFAVVGDGLKPKSFAGLFGAAPSVALATLALAVLVDGKDYAALEARSMIVGACSFFLYCCLCTRLLARGRTRVITVTVGALTLWLAGAVAGWLIFLK